MAPTNPLPEGIGFYPGYLDRQQQERLVEQVRDVVAAAPLYVPVMPKTGTPDVGSHDQLRPSRLGHGQGPGLSISGQPSPDGEPWPDIPSDISAIWDAVAGYPKPPEACLVNFYGDDAKMGLHQDRDEQDLSAPVVSISLGDTCLFRLGGLNRKDPTRSFRLESGDVLVLGGESRLRFHGVDRLYPGSSTLLRQGGRINLTLRRVNP